MNKNRTTKIVVIALFIAIVTAIIIAGTFAKYTTRVEGAGTAVVAHWSFTATGMGSTQSRVNLKDTANTETLQGNRIAPGTSGSFIVNLDARTCEVGVDYVVTLSNFTHKPTNLKFYKDANHTQPMASGDVFTLNGNIPLSQVGTVLPITIYWEWEYETTEIATNDPIDTSEGEASLENRTMEFDIIIVATQADPRV